MFSRALWIHARTEAYPWPVPRSPLLSPLLSLRLALESRTLHSAALRSPNLDITATSSSSFYWHNGLECDIYPLAAVNPARRTPGAMALPRASSADCPRGCIGRPHVRERPLLLPASHHPHVPRAAFAPTSTSPLFVAPKHSARSDLAKAMASHLLSCASPPTYLALDSPCPGSGHPGNQESHSLLYRRAAPSPALHPARQPASLATAENIAPCAPSVSHGTRK